MKHVMTIVFLGLLASCSSRQIPSSKVPSVVLNMVKAKYPDVKEVEWIKIKNGYEAEIQLNDSTEFNMQMDGSGKLVMQKEDIAITALPPAIVAAVNTRTGYTVDEAERMEKNGVTYYQLELEAKGKKDLELVMTEDGKEAQAVAFWD